MVKNLPAMGENSVCPWVGKIPEGSPGGGHGNHSSILAWRIPMDRGAWRATVYLLLLSSPYHFCLYWAFLCMKCSFGISSFLVEISSLSHSIVFLYFFTLFTEKTFLSPPAILWNSAFSLIYLSLSLLPFTSFLSYL